MRVLEPTRQKYFRHKTRTRACQFCHRGNIVRQSISKLAGRHWRAWVNRYPYLDGNLMLVPKRHIEKISDLRLDEWVELQAVLVTTQKALAKIFRTSDFNLALNLGKKAGASIPHLHWQLVPRPVTKISNSLNLFADLQVITVSPSELKKRLQQG